MNRRAFIRNLAGGIAAACGVGALVADEPKPLYNIVVDDPLGVHHLKYDEYQKQFVKMVCEPLPILPYNPYAIEPMLLCKDGKILPLSQTNQTGRVTFELKGIK